MTVAAPSTLMDELVELVKAALDTNNVLYGPPEHPPQYEQAWVRYGERTFEYGGFAVEIPAISITVAVKANGDYPNEYRTVNDMANTVAMAFLPGFVEGEMLPINAVLGELTIRGMSISEPARSDYAGEPGAIMAAVITLESESKEINA